MTRSRTEPRDARSLARTGVPGANGRRSPWLWALSELARAYLGDGPSLEPASIRTLATAHAALALVLLAIATAGAAAAGVASWAQAAACAVGAVAILVLLTGLEELRAASAPVYVGASLVAFLSLVAPVSPIPADEPALLLGSLLLLASTLVPMSLAERAPAVIALTALWVIGGRFGFAPHRGALLAHELSAIASAVLALSIGGLVHALFARALAAARRHEQVARARALELSVLAERLVRMREEERARLARELHDDTGQTVHALRLELDYASMVAVREEPGPRELGPGLARMGQLLDQLVTSLHSVVRALRPRVLDDGGIAVALEALASEHERATRGLRIRRDIDPGLARLDPVIAIAIYRVAQEALTNVVRHARASEARLSLQRIESGLRLEIEDDGTGIPPAGAKRGYGLSNMRERAALVGGSLELETGPLGTKVVLTAPFSFEGGKISSSSTAAAALALGLGLVLAPQWAAAQGEPQREAPMNIYAQLDGAEEEARLHYQLARRYFDTGRFADAASEFCMAYELAGLAELLYNCYLAHREAGQYDEALAALEAYIPLAPSASLRAGAESRLATLRAQRDAARALASAPDETPDSEHQAQDATTPIDELPVVNGLPGVSESLGTVEAEVEISAVPAQLAPRSRGLAWEPWLVLGGGAVLLLSAIPPAVVALDAHRSLDGICDRDGCAPGYLDLTERGRAAAIAADVLWISGTVTVAVALVWAIVDGLMQR